MSTIETALPASSWRSWVGRVSTVVRSVRHRDVRLIDRSEGRLGSRRHGAVEPPERGRTRLGRSTPTDRLDRSTIDRRLAEARPAGGEVIRWLR